MNYFFDTTDNSAWATTRAEPGPSEISITVEQYRQILTHVQNGSRVRSHGGQIYYLPPGDYCLIDTTTSLFIRTWDLDGNEPYDPSIVKYLAPPSPDIREPVYDKGLWVDANPLTSQEQAKAKFDFLVQAVDRKTRELILQGFQFDGRTFSLSEGAQLKMTALYQANAAGLLTFPYTVSCLDDTQPDYDIMNSLAMSGWLETGFSTATVHVQSGRVEKGILRQYLNSSDLTSLEAYVDGR